MNFRSIAKDDKEVTHFLDQCNPQFYYAAKKQLKELTSNNQTLAVDNRSLKIKLNEATQEASAFAQECQRLENG